jgi:peroxiredoxin
VLPDKGNHLASEFGLVFTLPDDLRELYSKYGIDLERFNGDDSWRLPIPGRFVIDSNSLIRYASVDPDYTARPEPRETVETVAILQILREKRC